MSNFYKSKKWKRYRRYMPLKKVCPGCGKLIDYSQKYCDECAKKYQIDKVESNRYYDKRHRKNKEVYHNPVWTKLAKQCKRKFKAIDIYSYYILNKIEYGDLSHHIETVEDCKSRRYDIKNLIYLSNSNHSYVHAEYNKSDENKRVMQELLFNLVKKWGQEFGIKG